jgi:nitrite reductase/ring-hydroxylating ferredoxin subunit
MPILKRRRENDSPAEFTYAAQGDAVAEDAMTVVKLGGRKVILTRHNGQPYAIDTTCPHAAADLSRGTLRGWQICCHEHDYCFDMRNGRIVWPEDEVYRLRRYETKEEDGAIFIRLAPPL